MKKLALAFLAGVLAALALIIVANLLANYMPARSVKTSDQPTFCVPAAFRELERGLPVCGVMT